MVKEEQDLEALDYHKNYIEAEMMTISRAFPVRRLLSGRSSDRSARSRQRRGSLGSRLSGP